jgi:LmbE family N-acetylglucosaminyl deacetylase
MAVCAHPDDESFGLGAVLDGFSRAGADLALVTFTRGEASTLGASDDLAERRTGELAEAVRLLEIEHHELFEFPDGHLDAVPVAELAGIVVDACGAVGPDLILTYDETGITGHPDHVAATRAALVAAGELGLGVLAWTIPSDVANELAERFGTPFRGAHEIDFAVAVDRAGQHQAIAAHASQAGDNVVLETRLALLGGTEHLRWLRKP